MEKEKISIIVPVYSVEKYLKECLDSLLNQTYKNLEIILVDDESPDNCPQICDVYAKQDDRIMVMHKKNGGAASARNVGLDCISGEYVAFVDSDDYVDKDYISRLLYLIKKENADISVCSFFNVYRNRNEKIDNTVGIYTAQDYLRLFLNDWKCGLIWNKLFKTKLMRNIRFAEGHIIDDEFFTYKAVMLAKKIVAENSNLYYYRKRSSGAMAKGRKKRMLQDRMEYMTERFQIVTKRFPGLYQEYLNDFTDNLIRFKTEAREYDDDIHRKAAELQKQYLKEILMGPLDIKRKYSFMVSMLRKKRKENGGTTKEDLSEYYE